MTPPPLEVDVGELRRRMRAQRRALDYATQRDHGHAITSRSLEVPEITTAETLGVYLADEGELGTQSLIEVLDNRGATIHLPVVGEDDVMRFRSWDAFSPLVEGRWNIPVPPGTGEIRSADQLDVVITPVVAVDRHGTRIGRGAGYYDRALAHRLERAGRPTIIGCAHDFQLVDQTLVRHEWDVPLDLLVTEERILRWTEGDPGSATVRVP